MVDGERLNGDSETTSAEGKDSIQFGILMRITEKLKLDIRVPFVFQN